MTYKSIADIKDSPSLLRRVAACAAQEGCADPMTWVNAHSWELAATPGWAEAWDSAAAGGSQDPGSVEGAITDAMILSRVQQIGDDSATMEA